MYYSNYMAERPKEIEKMEKKFHLMKQDQMSQAWAPVGMNYDSVDQAKRAAEGEVGRFRVIDAYGDIAAMRRNESTSNWSTP